jgi:hypothetical protein
MSKREKACNKCKVDGFCLYQEFDLAEGCKIVIADKEKQDKEDGPLD